MNPPSRQRDQARKGPRLELALHSFDLTSEEVRRTFERARRRGEPAWLWPELPKHEWRRSVRAISTAARSALTGGHAILACDNADAIAVAGYTSGMGPLLGWWIEQGQIEAPPPISAVLGLQLRHNRLRSARMRARAVEIADRLVGSGVAVLMLKGAHTGSVHFPDPATRPCADIDMLVEADQYDLAQQLLRAMGYRRQFAGRDGSSWTVSPVAEVPRSLRLVHADDPWSVDLHHSLKGQCASVARSIFFDSALPFATAEGWPPFERASVLGQPLLLHQLAVHAGTALHNMTLLRAVELHLVIKQDCARGALEWGEFLRLGRSLGTLGFAWPALKLCEDLVPGTLPEVVVAQCFDDAPAAVRRVVSRLEPATAQRIERLSIAEHFMWARDVRGRLRQLARDLVPVFSPLALQQIYARRLWQALRGPVTR